MKRRFATFILHISITCIFIFVNSGCVPTKQPSPETAKGTLINSVWEYNLENAENASEVNSTYPAITWKESTPEEQGMDSILLLKTDNIITNSPPDLNSVLVIRNGYIVYEKYYQGFNKDKVNNMKSCTKSIISTLIGIAIDKKYLSGIDQKLADFYPEYFENETDTNKKQISIKHLLTMTAGLKWDEGSDTWPWTTNSNPNKYVIDKPMSSTPGTNWNYSSGSAHLLSGIITKTSKISTLEFAQKYLFSPMGITDASWEKQANDEYYCGAGNLYLTPRDAAKIGLLYLQKGLWGNQQLVPEKWIEDSLTKQNDGYPPKGEYGYLWWINKYGGYTTYFAAGYGGQFIFIVPALNMIIVTTASWDKPSTNISYQLVNDYIVPSVINTMPVK
ncbi:MAG: serine hydrolase [Clostridiaceae bacterium]